MITSISANARQTIISAFHRLPVITVLIMLFVGSASAQTQNTTFGTTPLGSSPGAPAGSYSLSGFDNINLYNGHLNFRLPLIGVGGRGTAQYPITLPFDQIWTVDTFYDAANENTRFYPAHTWWQGKRGYGPGTLKVRYGAVGSSSCRRSPDLTDTLYNWSLTRLTFTTPDGTEYEMRDQLTGGAVHDVGPCDTSGFSRGTVFTTADGTSATFISDTTIYDQFDHNIGLQTDVASGYLMLRDGTRYRFDASKVTWMRDRNGNKLTFTYNSFGQVTTVTDSLNRQITISYDVTDVAPYGLCDKITFKGFGGVSRIVRISKADLGNALAAGYTLQTYQQLFLPLDGSSVQTHNPKVTSSVWLPNGQRYQFYYNSYGELARAVMPTGAAYEYDYAAGLTNDDPSGAFYYGNLNIYRRVVEKRIYANGTTLDSRMTYSRPEDNAGTNLGYVVVDQLNASGALLGRDKHYFYGSPRSSFNPGMMGPVSYPDWQDGREYQTEVFDTNGTTVLRRVAQTWEHLGVGAGPQITQTVTTLVETNQVTKQTFAYDQYGNKTDVYEYDYGTGVAGALVRRSNTTYLTTNTVGGISYNYATNTSIHQRSLPLTQKVYNAGGVEQARTTYEYDNYTATANHAVLVNRTAISGLDSAFTTTYQTRGNPTATTSYLLTNGTVTGSVSTYTQFDIAGNVVKFIDGRGKATTFNFADRYGAPDAEARLNAVPVELGTQSSYAFPTLVTNALGQTAYTQYDYYLSKPVDSEDANGITSSGYYSDLLDRPTKVIRAADDAVLHSQTIFSYDDTNRIITTTNDLDAFNDTTPLKSQTLYDGLGRTVETRQYETATAYITTKQTYDALGRVNQSSNPYRTGDTVRWTTTAYDALGRVKTVTTPDNAVVTTSYSGNTVTVSDQAGKDRQSTTDALGRLTQVTEDPGTGGLAYITTYAYDVLDNLTTVTQGAQTRTFVYDSLKRLSSATNPESGTVSYQYDNNGNLTSKTDARPITTIYTYDDLNRLTLQNYSDTTPDVRYYYDAQTLPTGAPLAPTFNRGSSVGRLVAVTYGGASAGSYYGYDGLGQVLTRVQQTDGVNYVVDATYDKAGAMIIESYPMIPGITDPNDRRKITYSYDAAGRLSALSSLATSYAAAASVSSISYAAHGGLSSETLGNTLIHAITYNNRLQPTQIKLGTSAAPTSVLNLNYNYGTTANNGNVLDVRNVIGTATIKQIYTYDALNRLFITQETNGSTTTYWTQTNGYDRYGNRWEVIAGSPTLSFNTQNRIIGRSYDGAGNLLGDGQHSYAYDAENRVITVDAASAYKYDGEGRRVRKLLGENLRFVYDMGGRLLTEFDGTSGVWKKEYIYGADGLAATIEPTTGTRYISADHLGTPRVVTSSAGVVISRHDYKPFGEELFAGSGGRTTTQGYGQFDGVRQRYAGSERDNETGLDFMQARYFSSAQGRFTSPDPLLSSGRIYDPQTWNRYTYALNNPLRYIDPTGLDPRWVTDDAGHYRSYLTDEAWNDFLNSDEVLNWRPIEAGTNIGVLSNVGGDTGFYLNNNQLEGQEVILGADGNFQLAHPESDCLNCAAFNQEMGRYAPALAQTMEIMFAVDATLIGGLTTLGSVGGATLGLETGSEAATFVVQFGRNADQVYHTFRHTDALGLSREAVQSAIQSDLRGVASQITSGQPFNQVITVMGQRIQYTAFRLANGVINIGRIHGVP